VSIFVRCESSLPVSAIGIEYRYHWPWVSRYRLLAALTLSFSKPSCMRSHLEVTNKTEYIPVPLCLEVWKSEFLFTETACHVGNCKMLQISCGLSVVFVHIGALNPECCQNFSSFHCHVCESWSYEDKFDTPCFIKKTQPLRVL